MRRTTFQTRFGYSENYFVAAETRHFNEFIVSREKNPLIIQTRHRKKLNSLLKNKSEQDGIYSRKKHQLLFCQLFYHRHHHHRFCLMRFFCRLGCYAIEFFICGDDLHFFDEIAKNIPKFCYNFIKYIKHDGHWLMLATKHSIMMSTLNGKYFVQQKPC